MYKSFSVTTQGVSHRLLTAGAWARSHCSICGIPDSESENFSFLSTNAIHGGWAEGKSEALVAA